MNKLVTYCCLVTSLSCQCLTGLSSLSAACGTALQVHTANSSSVAVSDTVAVPTVKGDSKISFYCIL